MSLVTAGFTPVTLSQTSLSVYMCAAVPNATQGQAAQSRAGAESCTRRQRSRAA